MRHRKRGRKLGRSSSHRRALLRNLASSLFLTERDAAYDQNAPKVKGRIITTLPKAKEVRSLVEKCITIARQSLEHEERARQHATTAARGSEAWRAWRRSDRWQKWNVSMAPAVAARRQALRLLGSKQAVRVLFDHIAPQLAGRPGGYTRVLRLARPRLGDAGPRAILELVGRHDRVAQRSERPALAEPQEPPVPQAPAAAPLEAPGPEASDSTAAPAGDSQQPPAPHHDPESGAASPNP